MQPRPSRLLVPIVLVLLVATVVLVLCLPAIRHACSNLVNANPGPQSHGSVVVRSIPRNTPYDQWLDKARGRIPVFEGLLIQDVSTVALGLWPEIGEGVNGLYLRFADYQITDGRILELPPHGSTRAQRHLYEMGIYFLGGPGHTLFFRDGSAPLRVDWQAGSLLSVPLNVRYQHFSDSDEPVRLLAVTSFPFALNASASERFVQVNSYDFTDRFDGSDEYFRTRTPLGDKRLATNFVPDVRATALAEYDERGIGSTTMSWAMAGNSQIDLHASEILPGTYKKAHRHSSDAFILILSGDGYSLIWPGDDVGSRKRVDWHKGTLFVPPMYWYHQHLNISSEPARYLAINTPALVNHLGLRFADQMEDEPREIRAEWQRELRDHRASHQ